MNNRDEQRSRRERTRDSDTNDSRGGRRSSSNSYKQRTRSFRRRKVCYFCKMKIDDIDYKNIKQLRRFVTERGKIIPRRITGTCAFHQRLLGHAIKRARNVTLLPYKAG